MTSKTARHTTPLTRRLGALLVLSALGCGLPGIPGPSLTDMSQGDLSGLDMPDLSGLDMPDMPDTPDLPDEVCTPGVRQCSADGRDVRQCNTSGTRFARVDRCNDGFSCRLGYCVPSTCSAGYDIKMPDASLVFDTVDAYDSGEVLRREVVFSNCSPHEYLVEKSRIISPTRQADGETIFSFATARVLDASDNLRAQADTPLGLTLEPGDRLILEVALQPRSRHLLDDGALLVELRNALGRVERADIALHTTQRCVGMPATLDVGTIRPNEEVSILLPFFNCSREPMTIRGMEVFNPTAGLLVDDDDESQGITLPPASLTSPGSVHNLRLKVRQLSPGKLDADVVFQLNGDATDRLVHSSFLTTHITGVVGQVDQTPCTAHPGGLPFSEFRRVEPWEPTTFSFDVPAGWVMHARQLDPAHEGHALRVKLTGQEITVTPTRVGARSLEVWWTDELGTPSCRSVRLDIDARPPENSLYIELSWDTFGDENPLDNEPPTRYTPQEDEPGRGVDLDLHVLFSRENEVQWENGGLRRSWNVPSRDCFHGLDAYDRYDDLSRFNGHSCAGGRGYITRPSFSGAHAEAVYNADIGEFDAKRVDIAVHVMNLGVYTRARARVRVWRDGQEISELSGVRELSGSPEDGSVWLGGTGQVWDIGYILNPGTLTESYYPVGGLLNGF